MKHANRSGISLVEMQVVISMMAVLLGFTGVCLHGMYRAQARLESNVQRRASLDRLWLRLCADAHSAVAVRLQDDDQTRQSLLLTASDGAEIGYRTGQSEVQRIVRQGEKVLHRDTFRLPGAADVQWQLSEGTQPVISAVVVPGSEPARAGTAVPMTIRATVGAQIRRQQLVLRSPPAEDGRETP
jgi:type II secretory pathway component PulJ